MANNQFPDCPAIMSDGRFLTNFAPRCLQEYTLASEDGTPASSFQYRQYLIGNAARIMQRERAAAGSAGGCKSCDWDTQPGAFRVQACDSGTCSFSPIDMSGLGLERA